MPIDPKKYTRVTATFPNEEWERVLQRAEALGWRDKKPAQILRELALEWSEEPTTSEIFESGAGEWLDDDTPSASGDVSALGANETEKAAQTSQEAGAHLERSALSPVWRAVPLTLAALLGGLAIFALAGGLGSGSGAKFHYHYQPAASYAHQHSGYDVAHYHHEGHTHYYKDPLKESEDKAREP